MLPMSKIRLILLSMLMSFVFGAIASSSASAAEIEGCKKPATQPKCLLTVEGKKLAKGEKEEFTAKVKTAFAFSGKLSGTAFEIKANKLKVEKGSNLLGGNPAEGQATAVFEEVKVEKPTGCEIEGNKIKTNSLAIWYGWLYVFLTYHGVDWVWLPGKGPFFTLTFKNKGAEKCALNGVTTEATGTILGMSPEAEATAHALTFSKLAEGAEFYEFGSLKPETPQLSFSKEPVTFTGAADIELVSKKKLGID
jgi:hypothetical protein